MKFATPRHIESPDGALFYHSMNVPGHGKIPGMCDVSNALPFRVERLNLKGRRVLEIGPASGFFTFEMERSGADVVAVELAPTDSWDIVPHGTPEIVSQFNTELQRVRDSFWFCHERFASKARVFESPVYDIPDSLGPFDVACIHDVLLHLRDPMRALQVLGRLADTLVVSEIEPYAGSRRALPLRLLSRYFPVTYFLPKPEDVNNVHTWGGIGSKACSEMLAVLGFTRQTLNYYQVTFCGRRVSSYTITGHRH